MLKELFVFSFVLAEMCISSAGYAESISEEYILQERCGKRAEEVFIRDHGSCSMSNTCTNNSWAIYSNHYNKKLKKCFILTSSHSDKSPKKSIVTKTLEDVNERKDYGVFLSDVGEHKPFSCTVGDIECNSVSSWEKLIAPYMEE